MKNRLLKLTCLSLAIGGLLIQPMTAFADDNNDVVMQEESVEAEVFAGSGSSDSKTGVWKKSGARWWYLYDDNTYPVSAMVEIGSETYAFDSQGWMITGWYKCEGKYYYFDKSGAMRTGWIQDGGVWYYLDPSDGVMVANTTKVIGDKTYRFNKSGAMLTGWIQDGENWYHYTKSGAMYTGWVKHKGIWYYMNPADGIMVAEKMEVIDGKTYLFDKKGAMLTGWQKKGDDWYYFEKNGSMKTGWLKGDGKWYYLDPTTGVMSFDCLQEIDEKVYGFKYSGEMAVGLFAKSEKVADPDTGNLHTIVQNYYFDSQGVMQTGWVEMNDKWSYFDPESGIRCEDDVYEIGGTNYAFDKNGIMVTGWFNRKKTVTIGGKVYYVTDKYYFNDQGMPQPGWVTVGTDKYWIDKTGWAVANGEFPVDKGRIAYFDENAKFIKFIEK